MHVLQNCKWDNPIKSVLWVPVVSSRSNYNVCNRYWNISTYFHHLLYWHVNIKTVLYGYYSLLDGMNRKNNSICPWILYPKIILEEDEQAILYHNCFVLSVTIAGITALILSQYYIITVMLNVWQYLFEFEFFFVCVCAIVIPNAGVQLTRWSFVN